MLYHPNTGVGSYGAHPLFYGIETYYRPWFFDGRIVYWGNTVAGREPALERAQAMADRERQSRLS